MSRMYGSAAIVEESRTARIRAERAPGVAPTTRAFLAVAALGAGLLHAALAPSAPFVVSGLLLCTALVELGWAAATLALDRPPLFRLVPALALVPIVLWATLVVVAATASSGTVVALPLQPMGVASSLDLAIAGTVAVVIRRRRAAVQATGALRFVVALALSAVVVCAITIPALGLTDAGVVAVTVHHH
ncbi:hypothetical protein ABCS02_28200 [Microbacterium sp. X-17]|uniref:hypothetical protein n=1 Tax=Microbacterium sp. X-17 TaxID=3144404 RepID=UPI0031F5B0B7